MVTRSWPLTFHPFMELSQDRKCGEGVTSSRHTPRWHTSFSKVPPPKGSRTSLNSVTNHVFNVTLWGHFSRSFLTAFCLILFRRSCRLILYSLELRVVFFFLLSLQPPSWCTVLSLPAWATLVAALLEGATHAFGGFS